MPIYEFVSETGEHAYQEIYCTVADAQRIEQHGVISLTCPCHGRPAAYRRMMSLPARGQVKGEEAGLRVHEQLKKRSRDHFAKGSGLDEKVEGQRAALKKMAAKYSPQ